MHLLTNERPVPITQGHVLERGQWLMGDAEAFRIGLMAGGGECDLVKILSMGLVPKRPYKSICIMRGGRYGDLTLLTPVLRQIKKRFPDAHLAVSCFPQYRDAIIGLPYIDEFMPYPMRYDESSKKFDQIICLEPLVSLSYDEQNKHLTEIFADRVGISLDGDNKEPDYFLSKEEEEWAVNNYPRSSSKRVALHIRSSTPSRDYPADQLHKLIYLLHKGGYEVVLLGLPNQIKWKEPEGIVVNRIIAATNQSLTFRQSCALLSTADAFIGPDSSLIHIAGALGIPAIGLFSNVPWQLRTKYSPKTFVLQSSEGCPIAPCFHAGHLNAPFPHNGPCASSGKCVALAGIDPERVVSKLATLL